MECPDDYTPDLAALFSNSDFWTCRTKPPSETDPIAMTELEFIKYHAKKLNDLVVN